MNCLVAITRFCCAWLVFLTAAHAAPIRLLHLDLNERSRQSNAPAVLTILTNAVPGIKSAEPDILLIQGIRDWKMAATFARSLGDFQVGGQGRDGGHGYFRLILGSIQACSRSTARLISTYITAPNNVTPMMAG